MKNSKGSIFYGVHMYPGVAEYREPGKEPYRVFLNEQTIRAMDPSFAGRPVFVGHVDEVSDSVDALKADADGWVVESFFNAADGKHWVKFIAVSQKAEQAIKNGWKLSNCYTLKGPTASGGLWNGVSYQKEIKNGEYHHLAIVPDPRYEESVIMSPEEFKEYNERLELDLKRLANDKSKEPKPMLKMFKREKVENSIDLESMHVALPKSGRELSVLQMANELDVLEMAKKEPQLQMANVEHMVEYGGKKMSVNELMAMCNAMAEEVEKLKAASLAPADKPAADPAVENADDVEVEEEVENEKDEKKDDKEDKPAEKKENSKDPGDESEDDKKATAKAKAAALKNAPFQNSQSTARVEISADQVQRGKSRYGSN